MLADKGISIIIAVWNQLGYTKLAVDFIMKNSAGMPYELIIVDNGSRPDVRGYFDSIGDRVSLQYIRNQTNLGPIRAINQGLKAAKYDIAVVVHNDVLVLDNRWLLKISSAMEGDPKIGIVGLAGRKEIYKTGCVNEESLKHSLQDDDLNGPMEEDMSEVAVIDGLCFAMRRALIDKIGGLDESYGYMHCYDLDVSLASIAAGFRNVVLKIPALHLANGGITRKTRDYKRLVKDDYGLLKKNVRILAHKWRNMLPLKVE
jgi:GT2 family glycosyltransferase